MLKRAPLEGGSTFGELFATMPQGDCRNIKILTMGLLLATMLLTGLPSFGAQVSIGIRIGQPPPPRVVYVLPANPGPEYVWVDGYWYPVGKPLEVA